MISSFCSKMCSSSGWYLSIGQARISINFFFMMIRPSLGLMCNYKAFPCRGTGLTVGFQYVNAVLRCGLFNIDFG